MEYLAERPDLNIPQATDVLKLAIKVLLNQYEPRSFLHVEMKLKTKLAKSQHDVLGFNDPITHLTKLKWFQCCIYCNGYLPFC